MTTDALPLTGRCLCGTVRYEVPDAFGYALNCHCNGCRRTTGAAFKSFAGIERERLRLTDGADAVLVYDDGNDTGDAGDIHCARCGSFLYSIVRQGAWVHVAMGTLIDTPAIRPSAHIFVGSKAPWFEITDDLPRFEEHVTRSG